MTLPSADAGPESPAELKPQQLGLQRGSLEKHLNIHIKHTATFSAMRLRNQRAARGRQVCAAMVACGSLAARETTQMQAGK